MARFLARTASPRTGARRSVGARLARWCLAAAVGAALGQALPARANPDWRPSPAEARFDLQLTPPFDLSRRVDVMALELFNTAPERIERLQARGARAVCHISAGLWENWRPDAASFPAAALGASPTGWSGLRRLDLRHPGLRPVFEKRLDLCRARGFDGVLFAALDGGAPGAEPAGLLAFARWLAAAARARGLAAGVMGGTAHAKELAPVFDFLVADRCAAEGDCAGATSFLERGKPAYLVAYTNTKSRMEAYCAIARRLGAPLIFKTEFLNGKLHLRCS